VPITTNVVNLNLVHGEVYSIHHYVIKFVCDFRQGLFFYCYIEVLNTLKMCHPKFCQKSLAKYEYCISMLNKCRIWSKNIYEKKKWIFKNLTFNDSFYDVNSVTMKRYTPLPLRGAGVLLWMNMTEGSLRSNLN
jgi:hypothetical protein